MTDFDQLANQILERTENTPELAALTKLELKSFNGTAAIMHEAGEMTVGDSDAKTAAWWAWRKYQARGLPSHGSIPPPVEISPRNVEAVLANGGELSK